jgi:hypothetical protein
MSQFIKKISRTLGRNATAVLYDSFYDFTDYVNQNEVGLSTKATEIYESSVSKQRVESSTSRGDKWYGTTNPNEVLQPFQSFLFQDRLRTELDSIQRNVVDNVNYNIDQKKQIVFTSQEIGIFSFDLASLGLIRVFEYYSPLLKRIVDGNFIRSFKTSEGKLVFYHIYVAEVPEHLLIQKNGKLFSPLLKTYINKDEAIVRTDSKGSILFFHKYEAEIPKHDVERIQQKNDDGKPKFSSTWKKSFIYIPKVEKELPQIDLIISSTFYADVSAQNIFWTGVAVNTILNILSSANMRFRVYVGISNSWSRDTNDSMTSFIKVKDLNDAVDANLVSILTSDARNFRYNFFKWIIRFADENGYRDKMTSGLGSVNDSKIFLKNAFIELMQEKKDFGSSIEDTLNPNTKIILTGVRTRDGAIQEIENVINQIKGLAVI